MIRKTSRAETMIRTTIPGEFYSTDTWETPPRNSLGVVKSFLDNPPTLPVPNPVVVPSPFFVHGTKLGEPGAHPKPVVLRYGQNVTVELEGAKLTTQDEDVFLAMMQLAQFYESLSFRTTISEIVRFTGSADSRETRQKVWRSLKRQNWASARILLRNDGSSFEYNVTFVVRYLVMADGRELCIELDPFLARMFERTGVTRLDTKFRRLLKGEISKRLYAFFARNWRRKGIYTIGLRKLCGLIGLEIKDKQPWQYRRQIKQGLTELHRKGFIQRFIIEEKTVARVSFPDAKLKEITEETLEEIQAMEHTAEIKKKRARYRKLEEGVPDGQCPHGYEFGDYCDGMNAYVFGQDYIQHLEACDYCGRSRACEDEYERRMEDKEEREPITDLSNELEAVANPVYETTQMTEVEYDDGDIERALNELGLSGECPHGHRWALDWDKRESCELQCDDEKVWKDCGNARLEAEDHLR